MTASQRAAICPHCGEMRTYQHRAICKKNPNPNVKALAKLQALRDRHAEKLRTRNAAIKQAEASQSTMTDPPTEPATPPAEEPAPAAQPPTTEPAIAPTKVAPKSLKFPVRSTASGAVDAGAFVAARAAELKKGNIPAPVAVGDKVVGKPRTQWKFTPSPLALKLVVGGSIAVVLAYFGWRGWANWRVRRLEAKHSKQPAVQPVQPYQGPRAWTPEPDRVVGPNGDIMPGPTALGGGYVPSPPSRFMRDGDESIRRLGKGG